ETIQAPGPVKTLDLPDEHVLSVDSEKRLIGLRVVRYNEVVEHPMYGRMLFQPGAFAPVNAPDVRLRMDHEDPPTGLGVSYVEDPVGPVIRFRVSKTPRGDEQLTLARDGVSRGTSPGFGDVPGKPQQKLVDGKVTTVYGPSSAYLAEVSTTWSPTFAGDGVMYMLHAEQKGSAPMGEALAEAPAQGPAITPGIDYAAMANAIVSAQAKANTDSEKIEKVLDKFENLIELQRSQYSVPAAGPQKKMSMLNWFTFAAKSIANVRMSQHELTEL